MSEWTLHTGFMGSAHTIHIDWFDHNNVTQKEKLEIIIQEQDKPRTLEIRLNDITLAVINSNEIKIPKTKL